MAESNGNKSASNDRRGSESSTPPASSSASEGGQKSTSNRNWRWEVTRLLAVAFYVAYGAVLSSHGWARSRFCSPPSSQSRPSLLCRGASGVLDASRALGLPFVPTADEASTATTSSTGDGDEDRASPSTERKAAGTSASRRETTGKTDEGRRDGTRKRGGKIRRTLAGLFDPDRRRREREEERRRRQQDEEKQAMREVVSKHRDRHGEEVAVDRRHPIRHMVDEAAALFRRRKRRAEEAAAREVSEEEERVRRDRREKSAEAWGKDARAPPRKKATGDLDLTEEQRVLVRTVSDFVKGRVPDIASRASATGWGGSAEGGGRPWWNPPSSKAGGKKVSKNQQGVVVGGGRDDLLDRTEGTRLVAAYLRIMQWPANGAGVRFPFGPCKKKGCEIDFAFAHTLEWREKYRPWCVTPSVMKENESGWVYARGHSPVSSAGGDGGEEDDAGAGEHGHSVVWYRPGMHAMADSEAYFRAILNSLDEAVADNMRRSADTVGRYNIVLDTTGFSLSEMPKLHDVKRAFVMLQDHFPDRLGVLLIANLGGAAKLFLRMVMPLITQEVRDKIHILPGDRRGSLEMLNSLIVPEFVPNWLGGPDGYRFDAQEVYGGEGYKHRRCTDAEGLEYLTTMPYHA